MDASTRNQVRLFVLVVLAFLPAIGLYWYANAELRQHTLRSHEEQLLRFAEVTAADYQRMVDDSRSLLGALAQFPEIRRSGRNCNRQLREVLRFTPQYTTLSLIGLDGYLACGSLTPEEGLYLGDRAYYREALATNRFAVGRYALGRITGKPTVGVAYPVTGDDEPTAVLAASIDLTLLGHTATRARLEPDATFTVLDRSGTILVRVPERVELEGTDTVGSRVPDDFPALNEAAASPYLMSATDVDGVTRLFAVAPLHGAGARAQGYILVGKDRAKLYDVVDSTVRSELQYLAVAGLAVLLLAWLFGHFALVRTGPPLRPGE